MYWVRTNCRLGSWAALFALCIQLALSFGHIHLEDIQGSSSATAAQLQARTESPADDDHGKPGHDFCAICAALSLTSSSVVPTISLLVAPVDRPHEWIADFRTAQVSFALHFHFQARAPPSSI
jgi:DUF2946 family protein